MNEAKANEQTVEVEPFDPVWGAAAIGAEIGVSPRQAFYLLEAGRIPGKKIGARWVSTRSQLRSHVRAEGV